MSVFSDARHTEEQSTSWRKAEIDEQIMNSKADNWWIKKHFGEHIKITGNLIFAKTTEDFLKEIERQNQKLKERNT